MDCIMYAPKTKALIRYAGIAQLICACFFAYAKIRLSPNAEYILSLWIEVNSLGLKGK